MQPPIKIILKYQIGVITSKFNLLSGLISDVKNLPEFDSFRRFFERIYHTSVCYNYLWSNQLIIVLF